MICSMRRHGERRKQPLAPQAKTRTHLQGVKEGFRVDAQGKHARHEVLHQLHDRKDDEAVRAIADKAEHLERALWVAVLAEDERCDDTAQCQSGHEHATQKRGDYCVCAD